MDASSSSEQGSPVPQDSTRTRRARGSKMQARLFRWSKRRELLLKTLVATAVVVLCAIIAVFFVVPRHAEDVPQQAQISDEQAALAARDVVRLSVGDESYDVKVHTSLTVEELMDQALELRPNDGTGAVFTYTKETSALGSFVTHVGSQAQQEESSIFWTYRINGVNATMGISQQRVIPGDVIEWRLAGPDAF